MNNTIYFNNYWEYADWIKGNGKSASIISVNATDQMVFVTYKTI